MKNSGICPKCGGKDVIKVPGEVGAYGTGNNIRAGVTIFGHVPISRYLCASCGFSEEWVEDEAGLARIARKYGRA